MIKNIKGFTIIELIMVIAIIGTLVAIALPRFVDLNQDAKIAATRASLGSLRSVLAIEYARSAVAGGAPTYPATITGANFADGKNPTNSINGQDGVVTLADNAPIPSGTATHATEGFWYYRGGPNAGRSGAYSNGTINTANY